MTIPFYSQEELDAVIAKERLWIRDFLKAVPATDSDLQDDQNDWIATRIARGDYPRPLVVLP